jgi:membrane-associated phospholipid phosphatase
VMLAVFCWAWSSAPGTSEGHARRQTILSSLIGLYLCVIFALVLRTLPIRLGPGENLAIGFHAPLLPFDFTPSRESSSFPSGHATMFFAFATGLWWLSPVFGLIGVAHAVFIDCLPRVYLGVHYPSDIVAGAVLSIATVSLVNAALSRHSFTARLVTWSQCYPAAFYSALLLMCVEIATEFGTARGLLQLLSSRHLV